MKAASSIVAGALLALLAVTLTSCASSPSVASAEEYYNLGIAYYDLGKFVEAERWFQKAKRADKTRVASEYNLGRIAYETGKVDEAIRIFEKLLVKDPDNVVTLKAAAFASLKNRDLDKAALYYEKVVTLLPETVDSTYNYALVLHGLKKHERALEILHPLVVRKPEDLDALLLLARVEKTLGRPEAVDTYAKRLELREDPVVRREYAEACEEAGLWARAVENYEAIIKANKADAAGVGRGAIRFAKARALLVAGGDGLGDGGLAELRVALTEGFKDEAALDALLADQRITVLEEVAQIVNEARAKVAEKDGKKEVPDAPKVPESLPPGIVQDAEERE